MPGLRNTLPSRVTATSTASSLSAACIGTGFFVLTRSTLTPFDNMGVITMKMISSTSITSTMGVTLISATTSGAFFFSIWVLFSECPAASAPDPGRRRAARQTINSPLRAF